MARGGIEGTGGRPASPSGGARSAGARSGGSGGSSRSGATSGGIARAAEQAAARAAKARKARADRAAYLKKYNMKRMPADAFTLTQLKNQMRRAVENPSRPPVRQSNPNGPTREMSPAAARKAFETWIRDEQKAGRLGSLTEPVGAGRTKPGKPAVKAKTPAKKAQVASLKAKAKASGKPRTRLVETRQSSANRSRQTVAARAYRASRGSA